MSTFKDKAMEDYLDLMINFEVKKREVKVTRDRKISLKLPAALNEIVQELTGITFHNKVQLSNYNDKVQCTLDKVVLDHDIMLGFFKDSVESIIKHLDGLFSEPSLEECKAIVMVGGYSESSVLQERIKSHFQEKKIIIPSDAGLAVTNGAVMFGHNPSLIAERICKYTYGTSTMHKEEIFCTHRKTRTFFAKDGKRCDDIFDIHVRAGDVVKVGEWQKERPYIPVYRNQTSMTFDIYCTKERSPELVTDEGCVKLGKVDLPMPVTTDDRNRKVLASFLFSGTELEVKVHDISTGAESKISLSFLGQ